MKNRLLFILRIILIGFTIIQNGYTQKLTQNWVCGNFGLVFNDTSASVKKDYVYSDSRGAGIISDDNGNLLFYTNGLEIRNKDYKIMPNGDSIILKPTTSSIHESLIVPQPRKSSIYYVFTTDPWNGQETSGLYYSVVDLTQDNGKGDVVIKRKRLTTMGSNKITAVFHKNGSDVWIITHQHRTNRYYAFLLTSSGINLTPVISELGFPITEDFSGQLKASPDGTKIACSYNDYDQGFGLFDFNCQTGELFNPMNFTLPITYRPCQAVEFSSDAKKLYIYQSGSSGESGLYQYDLNAIGYEAINQTRVLLYREVFNSFRQMQLAINGKIYITKGGGGGGIDYLGVISDINEPGKKCNVKENSLFLEGQSSFVASTPNFIQNYFFKTSFSWDQSCQSSPINFKITNTYKLDSVRWYFGEGSTTAVMNPSKTYNQAGDYKVRLLAYYPNRTDTISKKITINPYSVFDLGHDTIVCPGMVLTTPAKFQSYKWNTGDTTQSIFIKAKGKFSVMVKNSFGCFSSDSIFIDMVSSPVILLPDTIHANGVDSLKIDAGDFKSYSWSTGAKTSFIYVKQEGWYSVDVSNNYGCSTAKSFFVQGQNNDQKDQNSDWVVLNPKPSIYPGYAITFINQQTGFLITNKELLRTDDTGNSWNNVMNLNSGKHMAFKNGIGYIVGNGGVIYKSTHNGVGWNKITTPFTENLNTVSVIHPDTIYVTGDHYFYSSMDGGKTWNTTFIADVDIESSYFTNSKTGYIACKYGRILKTVNGGKSWEVKNSSNVTPSNFFKIIFVNDQVGYASMEFDEIYKTTDGGETWKEIARLDAAYGMYFLNIDTGFIVGEYGIIYKTVDGGKTWQYISPTGRIYGNDLFGVYFLNDETGFVTGLHGRVLKTLNGGKSWSNYSTSNGFIKQLQFTSEKTGHVLIGNNIYVTNNRGNDWTSLGPVINDNTISRTFVFTNDTIGFAIAGGSIEYNSDSKRVYKTTNSGKNWTQTGIHSNFDYDILSYIYFIDSQTGFVGSSYNGTVYKTTNGGISWDILSVTGLVNFQFLNSQIGYAIGKNSKLFKTVDGGLNWNIVFDNGTTIRSFQFVNNLIGYITGDNSLLYKTEDGGLTWKRLIAPNSTCINLRFVNSNTGYLLDDYGYLYQTVNGGCTWKNIYSLYGIRLIELRNSDIFIAGDNGSILRNSISCDSVSIILIPVLNPKSKKATLKAIVASNGKDIKDIHFQYGTDFNFENKVNTSPGFVNSIHTDSIYSEISGLKAKTTYYYRIEYTYGGKVYHTISSTFNTPSDYEISIFSSYALRCDEQIVSGQIISNDSPISQVKFQYGKDTLFTSSVDASPSIIPSESAVEVSAKLTGLEPLTKYNIRIKGIYQGKEITSRVITVQTLPPYDISFYNPFINGTNAKIYVSINSYDDSLKNISIEYGKTREYLQNLSTFPDYVTYGQSKYLEVPLTNLQANSVYFYRLKAQYHKQTIYSKENILNLTGNIIVEPINTIQKTDSSVMVQGIISANGKFIFNSWFEYGTTPALGDSVIASSVFYFDQTMNVSSIVKKLKPKTRYYFRIKAFDGVTYYYSDLYSYTLVSALDIVPLTDQNSVKIFPNPSHDLIYISSDDFIDYMEITDMNGNSKKLKNTDRIVDISDLPIGIYFIRIFTNNKIVNCKLIKI